MGPVFRAENSYTHRHMTEFTGLDMEMTFLEHYSEVLDMLDRTFNAVFDGLNQRFRTELDIVRTQHPFEDLRYKCPCLRFTYSEAMALLRTHGPTKLAEELAAATDLALRAKLQERIDSVRVHADDEDIGTEDEKLLGSIVADKYEQDFYIIDKFPSSVRPFYTMPDPLNPTFSNSYDIFIRGEEARRSKPRCLPVRYALPIAMSLCCAGHFRGSANSRPRYAFKTSSRERSTCRPHTDSSIC